MLLFSPSFSFDQDLAIGGRRYPLLPFPFSCSALCLLLPSTFSSCIAHTILTFSVLSFLQRMRLRSADTCLERRPFSRALHLKQNHSMLQFPSMFSAVLGTWLLFSSFPSADVSFPCRCCFKVRSSLFLSFLLPNLALFQLAISLRPLFFFIARDASIWIFFGIQFSSRDSQTLRAVVILVSFLLHLNFSKPSWVSFQEAIVLSLECLVRH